jgi:hypothetical protein
MYIGNINNNWAKPKATTPSLRSFIHAKFIRFAYDVEKAARAVEDSPLPQAFADALRLAQ